MSWNHRIVRKVWNDQEVRYGIHEVYYTDGKKGWTESPVTVDTFVDVADESGFDYVADLRQTLTRMLKALDEPVIDGGRMGE